VPKNVLRALHRFGFGRLGYWRLSGPMPRNCTLFLVQPLMANAILAILLIEANDDGARPRERAITSLNQVPKITQKHVQDLQNNSKQQQNINKILIKNNKTTTTITTIKHQ
jgi:hypothetical protein